MLVKRRVNQAYVVVLGDADKPLARPGRKQVTANKLGIYIQYTPYVAQYTS